MGKKAPEWTIEDLYALRIKAVWQTAWAQPAGFIFACIYLFFEYVRPQSIYPWIDFLPWAQIFAVLAFLFSFGGNNAPRLNRIDGWFITFCFAVLLSIAFSTNPGLSFSKLDFFYPWVVIYFAVVRNVRTKTQFYLFLLLYLLCCFKMTQHGFRTFAMRGFSFAGWGVTGGPGWFQNSGEFGIQLSIFLPIVLAFIIALRHHWSKWMRWFMYLFPITGIVSVVGTSSRGALLGLAAAGAWSIRFSRYFFRTLLAVVVVGFLVWQFVPPESKARIESAGEDKTSLHRLDRWAAGWEVMNKYPAFGVGFKAWEPYYAVRRPDRQKGSLMVHNIFVEAGTETGFIGLGVLLGLIVAMFRSNAEVRRREKENDDRFMYMAAHGFDGALIGLMISASFVTVLYYPYVWIHAAFCSVLLNNVRSQVVIAAQASTVRRGGAAARAAGA